MTWKNHYRLQKFNDNWKLWSAETNKIFLYCAMFHSILATLSQCWAMELLKWLKHLNMNLNKSYYRVKITKDSLPLVEFIFISAIVTVHCGTVVLFETFCFVCCRTTLSCKMHFGVERCCFSLVLLRSKWPKEHHHFEDCTLFCPAVRLLW